MENIDTNKTFSASFNVFFLSFFLFLCLANKMNKMLLFKLRKSLCTELVVKYNFHDI